MQYLPIVLITSPDGARRNRLASGLEEEGYLLLTAPNALVALEAARHNRVALILFDATEPTAETVTFCHQLMTDPDLKTIPLLVVEGGIAGLADCPQPTDVACRSWLDDLGIRPQQRIPSPWSWMVLRAHVRSTLAASRWGHRLESAVLQQHHTPQDDGSRILVAGDLHIDRDRREVTRRQHPVRISKPRLFDLLVYLVSNQGVTLTKGQILAQLWGYIPENTSTVAVHIRWLRELLEDDPSYPRLIRTVVGVGYRFVAAPATQGKLGITTQAAPREEEPQ